ncbi:hypothetical protein F4778DRAFT_776860 [Xylariomycetidae sp. FL2044]|nr:hypothetical protein F4778DRAFT_776860 [Xylariomycetidae sp. FL2044]
MAYKGEASWAMPLAWFLVTLVFLFLLLRLYTRIVCIASYGIDDHVYILAFSFLLIFTIFLELAAENGFGRSQAEIGDPDRITDATKYECIGQAFAIVGMAIANWSCGFFLLRLVYAQWHRISIWIMMALVGIASIAQVCFFWLSCTPFAYVYDRRIPGGYCGYDTRPTSYILCISTITVDVFFAVLPWTFIWKLNMPHREKLTIAISMSFGLFAAAAGIVRTTAVPGLYGPEYLRDSVGLIIWSHVEIVATLVGVGIPVCRPVYKQWLERLGIISTQSQTEPSSQEPPIGLETIGGSHMPGASSSDVSKARKKTFSVDDMKLGVDGPYNWAQATYMDQNRVMGSIPDNTSDENILGQEYRKNPSVQGADDGKIHVTNTYKVERS